MLKRIIRALNKKLYFDLNNRKKCILKASHEQKLTDLMKSLEMIIGDNEIINQYTNISPESFKHPYWSVKLRAQHSFQISLVLKAVKLLKADKDNLTIVDIGDSAGTHILYLKKILKNVRSLSVNLDKNAVEKIKRKGFEAICCRAEELDNFNIKPDIFISFQMLEHLLSPIQFLKCLSDKSECNFFVLTVPYKKNSKMGLQNIRRNDDKNICAENLHIFELSPEDWKLIFKFTGWKIEYEQIYRQYPERGIYKFTKSAWEENDFEGFFGVILEKDDTYKKLYTDWY